jgi:hypothetical protein
MYETFSPNVASCDIAHENVAQSLVMMMCGLVSGVSCGLPQSASACAVDVFGPCCRLHALVVVLAMPQQPSLPLPIAFATVITSIPCCSLHTPHH